MKQDWQIILLATAIFQLMLGGFLLANEFVSESYIFFGIGICIFAIEIAISKFQKKIRRKRRRRM